MKKRKTVGVFLGAINNQQPKILLSDLYTRLSNEGFDTRFFVGTEVISYSGGFYALSVNNDYHYSRFYDLSNFDDIDVLIIAYGSIHIYHEKEPIVQFAERFPKVPIVFLEDMVEYPGSVSFAMDNYHGSEECVEHLISEHGCKKIAFLGGPENNKDSKERLSAYKDVMNKYNCPVTDSMIRYGDYSENVERLVEELIDENPGLEAIVSANDEMALGIYKVCERRGLKVGEDLLVTGYDDIDMASYMNPPITTVRQNVDHMTQAAVDSVNLLLEGKPVKSSRIKVDFKKRGSCGCHYEKSVVVSTDEAKEKKEAKDIANMVGNLREFKRHSWVGPMMVRELALNMGDIKEICQKLGVALWRLGTKSSYITLFKKPYLYSEGEKYKRPESMYLVMRQEGSTISGFDKTDCPVIRDGKFSEIAITEDSGKNLISFLLYEGDVQYGVLTCEIDPREIDFYYTLSLHIATVFRFYELSLNERKYREELKKNNEILSFTATHDALTGAYNRIGALSRAEEIYKLHQDSGIIFFIADVDHLKEINDTFGHVHGDNAIRVTANILNEAIGERGVVARTGGDEFCCGLIVDSRHDIDAEVMRLRDLITSLFKKYNDYSDEEYLISVSIGMAILDGGSEEDLHDGYIKADADLYEEKKLRPMSIIKK